jgi:hypothetical protein
MGVVSPTPRPLYPREYSQTLLNTSSISLIPLLLVICFTSKAFIAMQKAPLGVVSVATHAQLLTEHLRFLKRFLCYSNINSNYKFRFLYHILNMYLCTKICVTLIVCLPKTVYVIFNIQYKYLKRN